MGWGEGRGLDFVHIERFLPVMCICRDGLGLDGVGQCGAPGRVAGDCTEKSPSFLDFRYASDRVTATIDGLGSASLPASALRFPLGFALSQSFEAVRSIDSTSASAGPHMTPAMYSARLALSSVSNRKLLIASPSTVMPLHAVVAVIPRCRVRDPTAGPRCISLNGRPLALLIPCSILAAPHYKRRHGVFFLQMLCTSSEATHQPCLVGIARRLLLRVSLHDRSGYWRRGVLTSRLQETSSPQR